MSKKYTFIDLFAGCGGLSEGFMSSNKFEGLAHVEWELPMVETLRTRLIKKWNHSEEDSKRSVLHFDIQNTHELLYGSWGENTKQAYADTNHEDIICNGLKGLIGEKDVDLIIGGPPCQAYSIAGRAQDKNSMKDDYRNYLFESFVEVVNEFKPKMFVFENVPGMLSAVPGGKKVTERIYEAFKNIGYTINFPGDLKNNVYSANDFDVPQKRKRLIIIGVNKDLPIDLKEVYKAIDEEKSENKPTVKDAIFNLPHFKPLNESKKVNGKNVSHKQITNEVFDSHNPRFHNSRDVKIFRKWIENDMNYKSTIEKINFYNELLNKKSNHAKYRNLEWNKPSPTIVAHLHKDGLMFIHPDKEQARSISIREAALIQSFPLDYEFIGSQGYCYKMIGNAVPPLMAKAISEGIYKYLTR